MQISHFDKVSELLKTNAVKLERALEEIARLKDRIESRKRNRIHPRLRWMRIMMLLASWAHNLASRYQCATKNRHCSDLELYGTETTSWTRTYHFLWLALQGIVESIPWLEVLMCSANLQCVLEMLKKHAGNITW